MIFTTPRTWYFVWPQRLTNLLCPLGKKTEMPMRNLVKPPCKLLDGFCQNLASLISTVAGLCRQISETMWLSARCRKSLKNPRFWRARPLSTGKSTDQLKMKTANLFRGKWGSYAWICHCWIQSSLYTWSAWHWSAGSNITSSTWKRIRRMICTLAFLKNNLKLACGLSPQKPNHFRLEKVEFFWYASTLGSL